MVGIKNAGDSDSLKTRFRLREEKVTRMKCGVPECQGMAIEFHEKGLHVVLCREHWRQAIAYSLARSKMKERESYHVKLGPIACLVCGAPMETIRIKCPCGDPGCLVARYKYVCPECEKREEKTVPASIGG